MEVSNTPLTIQRLQIVAAARSKEWHGENKKWTILEWAGAMCGEAGECANVAKKIRRLEMGIAQDKDEITAGVEYYKRQLGEEAGDVLIYLVQVCEEAGVDLETYTRNKFNRVSEKFKFPQRV